MQKHFEINYLSLRVSLISQQQAELPPYLGYLSLRVSLISQQ